MTRQQPDPAMEAAREWIASQPMMCDLYEQMKSGVVVVDDPASVRIDRLASIIRKHFPSPPAPTSEAKELRELADSAQRLTEMAGGGRNATAARVHAAADLIDSLTARVEAAEAGGEVNA